MVAQWLWYSDIEHGAACSNLGRCSCIMRMACKNTNVSCFVYMLKNAQAIKIDLDPSTAAPPIATVLSLRRPT